MSVTYSTVFASVQLCGIMYSLIQKHFVSDVCPEFRTTFRLSWICLTYLEQNLEGWLIIDRSSAKAHSLLVPSVWGLLIEMTSQLKSNLWLNEFQKTSSVEKSKSEFFITWDIQSYVPGAQGPDICSNVLTPVTYYSIFYYARVQTDEAVSDTERNTCATSYVTADNSRTMAYLIHVLKVTRK
jgi:hypothetical protein